MQNDIGVLALLKNIKRKAKYKTKEFELLLEYFPSYA